MTAHAIQRARERYGVTLTFKDIDAIRRDIRAGRAEWLGRQDDGSQRWRVHLARINFDVPVVYDPRTRAVVTILSPLNDQCAPTKREVLDAHYARRRRRPGGRGR